MSLCAPPLGGREGDRKNTTGDVGYPSIHSSSIILQLSRIARQGLSLCMAKIAIFPEVCLYSSVLWGIRAGIAQLGEWGRAPILDKLESFVVNVFWVVAGRFFE